MANVLAVSWWKLSRSHISLSDLVCFDWETVIFYFCLSGFVLQHVVFWFSTSFWNSFVKLNFQFICFDCVLCGHLVTIAVSSLQTCLQKCWNHHPISPPQSYFWQIHTYAHLYFVFLQPDRQGNSGADTHMSYLCGRYFIDPPTCWLVSA